MIGAVSRAVLDAPMRFPKLTYINSVASTADASVYDFGDFNIGSEGVDKLVIALAGLAGSGTRALSNLSIGGTNGTKNYSPSLPSRCLGIVSRVVQAAGNVNVTATWSGGGTRAHVSVWTLENYRSAVPLAATSIDDSNTGTAVVDLQHAIAKGAVGLYLGLGVNPTTNNFLSAVRRANANVESAWSYGAADRVFRADGTHVERLTRGAAQAKALMVGVWR